MLDALARSESSANSRYRLDFDISIRLCLFFAILGSKGMMFPIWKDACSPVQPLRTVILDLHGTAVAADLDMSSLLNIGAVGPRQKLKTCGPQSRAGLVDSDVRSPARGRGLLSLHGSHSVAHTDYDLTRSRDYAERTVKSKRQTVRCGKHTAKTNRSSSRVARRSRTHTSLLSPFGHAHFCAFPAALFV